LSCVTQSHDSIIYVCWLPHMCDMKISYTYTYIHIYMYMYMCVARFLQWLSLALFFLSSVKWHIHMCAMTLSYVWRDWFVCVWQDSFRVVARHTYTFNVSLYLFPALGICRSIYICIYVCKYTYIYIHIYICMQIYECIGICIYKWYFENICIYWGHLW